jgi:hypothetical protein
MKYYSHLSAPPPPFAHSDMATEHVFFKRMMPTNATIGITQLDGTVQNVGSYSRYEVKTPVQDWVFDTFPELKGHSREIGLTMQMNSNLSNGRTCQLPAHTDGRRGQQVLQYMFETGGADVRTAWWQEDGHTIYREVAVFNNPQGSKEIDDIANEKHIAIHKMDLAGLTLLDSAVLEKGHWYMLETNVIHSVHNVRNKRLALTVGFSNRELYELMAEKYKFK